MFRFAIRDVLWLTLVVGVAIGWWLDHSYAANRQEAAIKNAERIRTVLNDARTAYAACAQDFFQGRQDNFLAQEPAWEVADKSLDEVAAR
jgi:hypothetical protein